MWPRAHDGVAHDVVRRGDLPGALAAKPLNMGRARHLRLPGHVLPRERRFTVTPSRTRRASVLLVLAAPLAWGCAGRAGGGRAGAPSAPVAGGLTVSLEERSYQVSARGVRALNGALLRGGPRLEGRAAHAATDWLIRWSYVPVREGPGCACGRPRVELELVTTLPEWLDAHEAPEGLVRDWELFVERLRLHETRHQQLAVRNGEDLLAALADLRASDCENLREEAREAALRIGASYRERHESFDRETRFGLRPGGEAGVAEPAGRYPR